MPLLITSDRFRVWLASRGKVFGDLSESETKKYFKKFVEKWNDGDLKDSLYKGLSFADVDNSARTSHKWNFAKKMDTFKSDTLRDQVLADTRSASLLAKPGAAPRQGPAQGPSSSPSGANTFESEELRDQRRAKKERVDRKVDGRHRKEESEELAPRPDPGSFQVMHFPRFLLCFPFHSFLTLDAPKRGIPHMHTRGNTCCQTSNRTQGESASWIWIKSTLETCRDVCGPDPGHISLRQGWKRGLRRATTAGRGRQALK